MKAITISQPYASLIADGEKWVENRDWRAPPSYRGELAIHAGKGMQYLARHELRGYPTECIIAVVELKTAIRLDLARHAFATNYVPQTWQEDGMDAVDLLHFLRHTHTEGPICLVLGNVRKLKTPVYCKGRLGLWAVDATLEREIRRQVG